MSTSLTASQIDRAYRCPASFALPSVQILSGNEANRGTAIHRFLELVHLRGREEALAEVPVDAPWRQTCERIDMDELLSGLSETEVEISLAYNPLNDEARVIRGGHSRASCAVSSDEIIGKADLIITRQDGMTVVIDYKTGRHRIHVDECGQVQLLGLAVARERRLSQVCVAVIHIYEDGTLSFDEMLLRDADLERVARRVRVAFENVKSVRQQVMLGHTPDVVIGDHCKFCPAFRACPANINLARGLLTANETFESTGELTPIQAGAIWERVMRARRVLDEIELGLKDYIDHTPIPHPDGKHEIARVETIRETINGKMAVPVLHKYLGDVADEVIEPTVSKMALEKFVRAACEKQGEARAIIKSILSGLREAGAVKETVRISYRVTPRRSH